ncbi:DUF2330 domain-containing protein [Streptomyces sp. ITFR-16]|uniref:DUF2330 domain-containing protein n=1 Tax=Streptomyces sp. ITFR-16 TaxID=3075198 RepID=UPI0028890A70|nr:DUF2330 domain-containing protein [Streptomyces sp. ITFR-16]WNI27040.1 DUF2330 domain-containing protein [Streptomyces sp. ITFR-16]
MVLSLQLGSLIAPAYACGCGAMVVDRNSTVSVDRETSVVDWDGTTEQIVMQLTVRGNAPDAAWIMPVPHRATVKLGDASLFSDLRALTAPVTETRHYFWPREKDWPFGGSGHGSGDGAAAPSAGAPVQVVGRERLGPFDVARLAATDPAALENWLSENGFELPDRLAGALRPYVEQKWEYVAVRLAPQESGGALRGTLDPLRLKFASDRLVYPMRLSKLATTAQSLGLYVLADHRMEPRGTIGGLPPEVTYADRFDPAEEAYPALEAMTGGKPVFVTAIDQSFPRPSQIDGDHELRATAADTPYRTVRYRDELLTVGPMPAWVLSLLGVVAVAAAVLLLTARARRRRPVLPPPPVTVPPPLVR